MSNGADWAFMGYQNPHYPDRDQMAYVVIAISVDCTSYIVAVGHTYAEALQRCMDAMERENPDRKWYEPDRKGLPAGRPELGDGG